MALEPKKMKVGEMREALEARGLDTSGLKNDLIHRLEMALDEEEFGVSDAPSTEAVVAVAVAAAEPVVEPVVEETATDETPRAAPASEAPAMPAAVPVDLSDLAKKKAERAARFGIPVTQPVAVAEKPKGGHGQEKKNGGKKSESKQLGGKMSEEVSAAKVRVRCRA
jgi:SAP domain-containing ribonucleoprotein